MCQIIDYIGTQVRLRFVMIKIGHGVAVSDTYRDEISHGYPIRDRIYYGWHHILGWHIYQVTLTWEL